MAREQNDAVPGLLQLRGLVIDPPLLNASGAFDVSAADPDWAADPAHVAALGAYVTKTVTTEARAGNPAPWVEELGPDTLVNSVGLANPGIDEALVAWAGVPELLGCPVLLSLGGDVDELADMVIAAERAGWMAGYELNLSCPNIRGAGAQAASDPNAVAAAVAAVRGHTERPVIPKLSAACGDLAAVARAAEAAGADAISAVNTMPVRALDDDGEPVLGSADGGMSGAALHPIALRAVATIASATELPVIGIGGVASRAGARRMFRCGARAVGIGSAAAIAPTVLRDVAALWRSAPVR